MSVAGTVIHRRGFHVECEEDTALTSAPSLQGCANLNSLKGIELGVQDTLAHLGEGVKGEEKGVGGIRSDPVCKIEARIGDLVPRRC